MYFMNYNFMSDKNIIDPASSYIPYANGVQITNAIFDHLNVTNNGLQVYNTDIPDEWDTYTIMDTNFEGNINAGNFDYSTRDLAGVKIKRRVKGTFAWLTLYDIALIDPNDLSFTKYDLLNQHGITYEYAFVPYLQDGTECAYIIKEIESKLDGVYLCSNNSIARFYGGLSYGTGSVANKTGIFEPIGSKYPVVVANANTQYYSGSLQSVAMSYNQLMNDKFDRVEISSYIKILADFITDKNTKVLKDWNGNLWLVAIVDNPQISYDNNVGMGKADVSFNFVEIGSASDQVTLEEHGFINIGFTPTGNTIPSHEPRPQNQLTPVDNSPEYMLKNTKLNVDPINGNLVVVKNYLGDSMEFILDELTGNLVLMSDDALENITFTVDNDGVLTVQTVI